MTVPTITPDQTAAPSTSRARVLSGMRPTGRLHLGNYMGALYNWVKLQHEYECYFFIADWHALTTEYADTVLIQESIRDVTIDFLAAGLAPELIFVQSDVTQHAELDVLLSNITPVTWLERVPTYKDQQEELKEKDLATYGFLGYPLLQSADNSALQAGVRSRGPGPGGPRGDHSGDRAAVQPHLRSKGRRSQKRDLRQGKARGRDATADRV